MRKFYGGDILSHARDFANDLVNKQFHLYIEAEACNFTNDEIIDYWNRIQNILDHLESIEPFCRRHKRFKPECMEEARAKFMKGYETRKQDILSYKNHEGIL